VNWASGCWELLQFLQQTREHDENVFKGRIVVSSSILTGFFDDPTKASTGYHKEQAKNNATAMVATVRKVVLVLNLVLLRSLATKGVSLCHLVALQVAI
jgi:hypothetical protein